MKIFRSLCWIIRNDAGIRALLLAVGGTLCLLVAAHAEAQTLQCAEPGECVYAASCEDKEHGEHCDCSHNGDWGTAEGDTTCSVGSTCSKVTKCSLVIALTSSDVSMPAYAEWLDSLMRSSVKPRPSSGMLSYWGELEDVEQVAVSADLPPDGFDPDLFFERKLSMCTRVPITYAGNWH